MKISYSSRIRLNLLLMLYIASAAMITIPTANTMSADTTKTDLDALERRLPPPSEEEVSAHASSRRWVFFTIAWAIVTALVTAGFTWVLRGKDSNASDLTQRRYGLATALALKATEELERENLSLKTRLAEHDKQVAALEKAASDAKSTQQRVEIQLSETVTELEKQRERTAVAERALMELQERLKPRQLRGDDRVKFVSFLQGKPKGKWRVEWPSNDVEAEAFASEIIESLMAAGWPEPRQTAAIGLTRVGLAVLVNDDTSAPAKALQDALMLVGFGAPGYTSGDFAIEDDEVKLVVGPKPR